MKIRFLIDNPPMTALLGCFLGGGFVWLINAGIDPEITKYGTYGITALSTLLASSFAWAGVMTNIENQNRIEDGRRSAELIVARANLNLALSTFTTIHLSLQNPNVVM